MSPGWHRLNGFQAKSPRTSPLKTIAEREGVLYIQTFSKGAVTIEVVARRGKTAKAFLKIGENRSDIFYLRHAISKLSGSNLIIKKPAVDLVKQHTYAVPYEG